MIKRQNLKVVENTVNKVSCAGDEKSGKHPLVEEGNELAPKFDQNGFIPVVTTVQSPEKRLP